MYYQKNSGNAACRTLEAKTPSRRLWCDNSCFQMVSVTDFTAKICPASLISFFQNTKPSFLLTAAFGTDTPAANMPQSRRRITIFGSPKFRGTLSVINQITPNCFELGWKVIEIWQCKLKPKFREQTLNNQSTY